MPCPRCQHENRPQATFCEACGTPLTANPSGPPAPSYSEITSALREALEQQTATAEILRVISSSPTDVQPVFDAIVASAVRLCDASFGGVLRFDGEFLHIAAVHNIKPERLETFTRLFPMRPTPDVAVGRAILEGTVVHFEDVLQEPSNSIREAMRRALDYRAWLAVPILREGAPLGVIFCWRPEPRAFTDKQVALVRTFAAQAVIAIENVRLFNETKEALEQQTATGEILRVIASSPTDLQPVMDAVAENAARVCGATDASIFRLEGESLRIVAVHGLIPGTTPIGGTFAVSAGSVAGRVVRDRKAIHIEDFLALPEAEFPETAARTRHASVPPRTVLATPLLREGLPIGVIYIRRSQVQPFTDKQIALAKTFADQAVIAIENVRLFQELQARNEELTGALARQTATSEILQVISRSPTATEPVFEAIVKSTSRLLGGAWAALTIVREGMLHVAAHELPGVGTEPIRQWLRTYPRPIDDESQVVVGIRTGQMFNVANAQEQPDTAAVLAMVRAMPFRGAMLMPMLKDGQSVGGILAFRPTVGLFTNVDVALLRTFADQAVIAIENVRLFSELQGRNRELTESLEQQTATGEILRVIASSPTDTQPVFEAIARSAMRLCEAAHGAVLRFDGSLIHLAAVHGMTARHIDAVRRIWPRPVDRGTTTGRAILTRAVVHVDIAGDPEFQPIGIVQAGFRVVLTVPMLRDGEPIGAISITREENRPFTDVQIRLLQTFADQAVIAIENVRLFKELQEKNRSLTEAHAQVSEALERQTATADIHG